MLSHIANEDWSSNFNSPFSFLKQELKKISLFLERGEGRRKERERNINVWLPLKHPLLGTWPQLRHVP